MQKNLKLLFTLFLLCGLSSGATASYSITDMNISVKNGNVVVYVECYDDIGVPANGSVSITIYNEQGAQPFGVISGVCGYNDLSGYGTLEPKSYYAIAEITNNCNPAGACSYRVDFVVPKKLQVSSIEEIQPELLLLILPAILFLIKRGSKKS